MRSQNAFPLVNLHMSLIFLARYCRRVLRQAESPISLTDVDVHPAQLIRSRRPMDSLLSQSNFSLTLV